MDEVKKAIEAMASKSIAAGTSHEAMQFAQAALSLAHVAATLDNIQRLNA